MTKPFSGELKLEETRVLRRRLENGVEFFAHIGEGHVRIEIDDPLRAMRSYTEMNRVMTWETFAAFAQFCFNDVQSAGKAEGWGEPAATEPEA